ncbi:hypothetical protein [Fontibacillus sp. BL9]|uniref:hypothetical protein n=1 Tax=Fontibacillus sp. BL9 TaxID=3389971 RepID=UPI00397E6D5B
MRDLILDNKSHRRFLKKPILDTLDVGDSIANILIDNQAGIYLYDLIENNHLVAVFLSTECDSCETAMEAMEIFHQKNPAINIVAFIHTELSIFIMLEEYFKGKLPVFHLPKIRMNEELRIYSFPRGFTINSQGQVLRVEICGQEFIFDLLRKPLRKLLPYQ